MASTPPLLTIPRDVTDLCRTIRDCSAFGLDTEFVTEHTYHPELALVQIAVRNEIFLIDPLAVPELGELWELVVDPSITSIMHGAEQEARFCWQETGQMPGALFDVQLAVAFTGARYPLNYASLVQTVLGVRMRQNQTRTDWTRRPLAAAQLGYAVEDVDHLFPLHERLTEQLDGLDRRAWFEEENDDRLESIAHDLTHPRWWRVSGTQGLSRRSLAAVRELYFWREEVAERRDTPRRRVLRDDLIVSAASTLPAVEDDLRRLRGFQRRQRGEVEDVLNCLRRAIDMPDSELPESRRPRSQQSVARMVSLLMEAVLEETCADQQIDATLVGTASDLRELVRWHLAGRDEESLPALKRGWRATVCGDILEAVLAGQVHVSVSDPAARRPLAIERAATARPDSRNAS